MRLNSMVVLVDSIHQEIPILYELVATKYKFSLLATLVTELTRQQTGTWTFCLQYENSCVGAIWGQGGITRTETDKMPSMPHIPV